MRSLSASELLDLWERGMGLGSSERALTLLAGASPELSADDLAQLSIGQRDGRLLALRERTFGERLVSIANCPSCADRLELEFTTADIRADAPAAPDAALALRVESYAVRFRLPNSLDLASIAAVDAIADARRMLLERCVLSAHQGDATCPIDQLPEAVIAALAEHMASADPQADVRLALVCPACGQQWQATFDIVSFFWAEIEAWAVRTLQDVHTLALRYGWRESDILAMSAWRRQRYLELINGN